MNPSQAGHVVIVGASSQIGRALVPRLASAGHQVSCVGRENRDTIEGGMTHVFDEPRGSFVPPLEPADAVISLAPLPTVEVAIRMAQVLEAKRIIVFGSTGVFSKRGSTSAIERDFVAQQERAETLLSTRCGALGIGWTLFRPTMIYGADADLNVSFIRAVISRFGVFPIPVGASGLRQPVHVDDLAGACVAALGCGTTLNKAYNLGGGEVLGFPALVRRVFGAEGRRPVLIPVPVALYRLLIAVAKRFPKAAFVREEMVERMFRDLTVDNRAATDDFGYAPRPFCPRVEPQGRGAGP
jgi:nucleoside-diphosphate-sugar epimerase